jgi:hypothetical protein
MASTPISMSSDHVRSVMMHYLFGQFKKVMEIAAFVQ